jgi:hypothetical protein
LQVAAQALAVQAVLVQAEAVLVVSKLLSVVHLYR